MRRFTVVIPSVRETTLATAVESIKQQDFSDWDLIVVGQGDESTLRSTVEQAADGDDRVRYIHLDERGVSGARNAGLASAGGEIVAFMDDDCEAAPDWLRQIDECFESDIGLVTGALIRPLTGERFLSVCPSTAAGEVRHDPALDGFGFPHGFTSLSANMAVRRDAAVAIGGFDKTLGAGTRFGGGEDHDFAVRMIRAGTIVRSTPRSVVHHTYGFRYGLKAVISHRRDRIRGDGAFAGKYTLFETDPADFSERQAIKRFVSFQLRTLSLKRLPAGLLRLFYGTTSYRECVRNYEVLERSELPKAHLSRRA